MKENNCSKLWKAFKLALGHMVIIGIYGFIFIFPYIISIVSGCSWWLLLYPILYLAVTTYENYRSNI